MKMLTQGPSFTAPYKGTMRGEVSPAHDVSSSARNISTRTWRGPEVAASQGEGPGLAPRTETAGVSSGDSEARQGPGWARRTPGG